MHRRPAPAHARRAWAQRQIIANPTGMHFLRQLVKNVEVVGEADGILHGVQDDPAGEVALLTAMTSKNG